jgi:UbiD family decarboxylase
MTFGMEPVVWIAASHTVPQGISELEYAGWMRGEPVDVIRGEHTGLPIPATGELAMGGGSFIHQKKPGC